jgi:hypothetical protein
MVSMDEHTPPPGTSSEEFKVNENLIYLYRLSVNYNNRSPAVGNDSQNGIHCCRRAAFI